MKELFYKYRNHILMVFLFVLLIPISIVVMNVALKDKTPSDDIYHDYATVVVTDKAYEEGYGWFWFYHSPKYYIISEEADGTVWSTVGDETLYHTVKVGDVLTLCTKHKTLKQYE